jgi:septum formation protein
MRLVLGSGSPRRLELLAQIGVVPDEIRAPDIDETPKPAEKPREYCNRIAKQKLVAIPASGDELVLCADTTVALGRRIMGKPDDAGQAAEFLLKLSGRRHRVVTAIAMKLGEQTWTRDVVSTVQMKRLSDVELNGYLATDDWRGKAGGYAIQGPAATLIPFISGSFSAVVGLPLAETASLLRAAGYPFMRAT